MGIFGNVLKQAGNLQGSYSSELHNFSDRVDVSEQFRSCLGGNQHAILTSKRFASISFNQRKAKYRLRNYRQQNSREWGFHLRPSQYSLTIY